MSMLRTRRNTRRRALEVDALEGRAMLSTASPGLEAQQVPAGSPAYVNQLYYYLLDRAPTSEELTQGAQRVDAGQAQALVAGLLSSDAYRATLVRGYYQDYLGRDAEQAGLDGWVALLGRGASIEQVQAGILSSPEYFQTQAGGTNAGYVRALYTDVLLRGVDASAQGWVSQLDAGASRTAIADGVLGSPEADLLTVNQLYAEFLARTPDSGGQQLYTGLLASGTPLTTVVGGFALSQEFQDATRGVTNNAVEALLADPNYSTLAQAVQAAGLVDTLTGPGPFTIFAPNNAAFAALPAGVLDNLLMPANQQQLRSLLLYHVVPGIVTGPEVASEGLLTTAQGSPVGVSLTGSGGLMINDADIVAPNVRVQNGIVHGIDQVLMIPTNNIVQAAQANPDLSTLVTAVTAAGLGGTLSGPGPFTVFAPNNAAFAALPAGVLDNLLMPANQQQLRDLLLYHVVPGQFGTDELFARGELATVLGPLVRFSRSGNAFLVNNADIVVTNLVTTNGVVQVIDAVLMPPTTA